MLHAADILARLTPAARPAALSCLLNVDSTMDHARAALQRDTTLQSVVVSAEFQQAGRGRNGRNWQAAAGSALLCSYGLRNAPAGLPVLGWCAAVAAAEAIEHVSGLPVQLKWPNDLLLQTGYGPAKVGGLLIESGWLGMTPAWSIIGCGINLSSTPPPDRVRLPATSLSSVLGRNVERAALLAVLIERLHSWLAIGRSNAPRVLRAWRWRLWTLGRRVSVDDGTQPVSGVAVDVDGLGHLVLRCDDGTLRRFAAADVSLSHH